MSGAALCVLALSAAPAGAQTRGAVADAAGLVAEWLMGLQFTDPALPSYGAVRVHHTHGLTSASGEYFRVSPYDANLGLVGLLHAPVPRRHAVVERWIDWYLQHADTTGPGRGIVYDHWYLRDGTGQTTCPPPALPPAAPVPCRHVDAADSGAATFLRLVEAYHAAGGNATWLGEPARRAGVRSVAELLLRLQQPDGLTWAGLHYPVKYLMDNSEAYRGLRAMASLEAEVYGDAARAARYARAADRVREGVHARLLDPSTGVWHVALHPDGRRVRADLRRAYPDAVAQLWPLLFGVSRRLPRRVQTPPTAAGAYALLVAGQVEEARRQAEGMAAVERLAAPRSRFAWPFTVGDAGWLLLALGSAAPR